MSDTAVWDVSGVKSVAVIGGGVAGLQTVKQLTRSGFDVTLFESRPRAGGVWSTGTGYYGTGLQVPYELYEFPDYPIASANVNPDKYPTQAQLQAYIDAYIKHFKIGGNLQLNTTVVSAVPEGNGWSLTTRSIDNNITTSKYDFLVIATGMYSSPNIPVIDANTDFKGQIIHSSFVSDPSIYKDKNVVIVGFGKSSTDNAILAVNHGAAKTTLVARQWHWPIPQRLLNILDIKWGTMHRLTAAFIPLWVRPNRIEKALHTYAPFLVNGFWRLLEIIFDYQFKLKKTGTLPTIPIQQDLFNNDILFDDEFYSKILKGLITPILGEITKFNANSVTLKDGKEIPTDLVVFGTGWKKEYPFLPSTVLETLNINTDGHYLYHHILHPDIPRLAFVGANISTLHTELNTLREWKVKNFPNCAARGALLQLHMSNYHSELSEEIGASRYRKSNPVAEVLMPYESLDFAPVVSGTYKTEKPSLFNRIVFGFIFVYIALFWTKISTLWA